MTCTCHVGFRANGFDPGRRSLLLGSAALLASPRPVLAEALAGTNVSDSKASSPVKQPVLRRFPYPCSSAVTFASDCDMQFAWHGAAIYDFLNTALGLPIADSFWVLSSGYPATQGHSGSSSLFLGPYELNRTDSKVDGHPVYGLLLRQWHRGNIDTLHGWTEDNTLRLRNVLEPPRRLDAAVCSVPLPTYEPPFWPNGLRVDIWYYDNLRLYFRGEPPPNLALELINEDGTILHVEPEQVRQGASVVVEPEQQRVVIDILFSTDPRHQPFRPRHSFPLPKIREIRLIAPSCIAGCDCELIEIERDNFSRRTVLAQADLLKEWNIRPGVVTCHGGRTQNMNIGTSQLVEAPALGWDAAVDRRQAFLANDTKSHSYQIDIWRELGVDWVWPMGGGLVLPNQKLGKPNAEFPPFYTLNRTWLQPPLNLTSIDSFRKTAFAAESALQDIEVDPFYCGDPFLCNASQAAMFGLQVAASLRRAWREPVDHIWYTHLGSSVDLGPLGFTPTRSRPFPNSGMTWARRLSEHYYGFPSLQPGSPRLWVAPTITAARYRLVYDSIAGHLDVDPETSHVQIRSWRDPVTGRTIPAPAAGTRDLHGITVYVPDAAAAHISVDGEAIHAFTRNPPDSTGRPSVTIVDDSAPTIILDRVPLSSSGKVEAREGVSISDLDGGQSTALLIRSEGDLGPEAAYRPRALELWNTTHLQLRYRKVGHGTLVLVLIMADGGEIAIVESVNTDADALPAKAGSGWVIPVADAGQWATVTLAAADLLWRPAPQAGSAQSEFWRRPPLPVGRVAEIRMRLSQTTNPAALEIDRIVALRPNTNGVAPGGTKLVSGRVVGADGTPKSSVRVIGEAKDRSWTSESNEDGYFFFPAVPKGTLLQVSAIDGERSCGPFRGSIVDVRKDEAEIDIDFRAYELWK